MASPSGLPNSKNTKYMERVELRNCGEAVLTFCI